MRTSAQRVWTLLLFMVMCVYCTPSFSTTVYVKSSGNDANTGSSWDLAKKTVPAAVTAAAAGDEIWVAAGTYVSLITLNKNVALYGGFAGTETSLTQRNWSANVTILDGNLKGSVITVANGIAGRIDGFTIRNGYAGSGGGVYCGNGSTPTIEHNIITGNRATGVGGGVCCNYASATVIRNTITGNTASGNTTSSAAGIYCRNASPTIMLNIISNNVATYHAGGVYCYYDHGLVALNIITQNRCVNDGGGICTSESDTNITHNTITGNKAGNGGGIFCQYDYPKIHNNVIAGNTATDEGGGIYTDCAFAAIHSNTIVKNTADAGGALYCYFYYSYYGATPPTFSNNIMAANSSGIYLYSPFTPYFYNNCVHGNTAYNYSNMSNQTGKNGNISISPAFVDPANGNFHLTAASPCIDAGRDSSPLSQIDIDEDARIVGAHVDIGADEYFLRIYRPDMQIRNISDGSYIGGDIYLDGEEQEVTGSIAGGTTAVYALKVENDGNVKDTITLTGESGLNGWIIRYFDALVDGEEITMAVTTTGYTIADLGIGEAKELRVEVTPIIPNENALTLTFPVTANSTGNPSVADTVSAVTTASWPLFAVHLTTSPASPVTVGTPVTLTATPAGGANPEYRFMVFDGSTWSELRPYHSSPTCTWMPAAQGSYLLQVRVREIGSKEPYSQLTSIPFKVNPPVSAVALKGTPVSPITPGTAVTFTATPTGGGQLEYRFLLQCNGGWTEVRGWAVANTYTWTPTEPGAYAMQVRVREVGCKDAYQAIKAVGYKVAPPITQLSLSGTPSSPVVAGTPVTLTAQAVGGTTPEYRFLVKSGATWTVIQNWGGNTCTWTPTAPGTYTVQVRVREQGSTVQYTLYRSVSYAVNAAP